MFQNKIYTEQTAYVREICNKSDKENAEKTQKSVFSNQKALVILLQSSHT